MHLRIHNVFQKGEMLALSMMPDGASRWAPWPIAKSWDDWIAPIATVVTKGSYRPETLRPTAPYDQGGPVPQ